VIHIFRKICGKVSIDHCDVQSSRVYNVPKFLYLIIQRQRPWVINVWCGIIGKKLIGPYFIDDTLNGEKYRNFLVEQLPLILEELPLSERMTL